MPHGRDDPRPPASASARREFDKEITEQYPDERISWKPTGGDVQQAGTVGFETGSTIGLGTRQVKADARRFKNSPTGQ